ncbi:uncharacterized protein LOC132274364 [Cornus florida]|uniref:uncharacterized protein LOC132274364 n=1 Tax=Cornus florida TaxID=4283 RepID=UPI00289AE8C4|nr:uncharacterized protein LOC132274364 [Cornus florida]
MVDQEEDDLQVEMRMSMQHDSPGQKRSEPRENTGGGDGQAESPEVALMSVAAEKAMMVAKNAASVSSPLKVESNVGDAKEEKIGGVDASEGGNVNLGKEISADEANQLFSMVFGSEVTKNILVQWSNQGIRFSPDPETSMGLVQHEGGACGVLAAIQAFVLKYLLFYPEELGEVAQVMPQKSGLRTLFEREYVSSNNFASFTEDRKSRALVRSMGEILFLCGSNKRAVIATLSILDSEIGVSADIRKDEIIGKALEGLSIESGSDLQKYLRVYTYSSRAIVLQRLEAMISVFRSRMGAMLFLISALLSRGPDSVQADRDDPSQSLVTAPFGHASQEIVNLLLSGQAVTNVFDGRMDLGGGMFVKGISTIVEVGFLTLLESFNYCKVGGSLKCPKWPIWVVGSESHYTVLFALDTSVQNENELEERETQIRRAFDAQDQSGGGGFIEVEGFHQVLQETSIYLPDEKLDRLRSTGLILWSEFLQVLIDLDQGLGGLKDSTGLMGRKVFDLYHFNGIAKSVLNSRQSISGGQTSMQRPRLTKLRVSVPPKWTPEQFMTDAVISSGLWGYDLNMEDTVLQVAEPEPSRHAPLVECIRTRWPHAICNWEGEPPSIV